MTCYICDPENPNADEEGCASCEADWIAYYYAVYAPADNPSTSSGGVQE